MQSTTTDALVPLPSQFGKYAVVRELGRGGMAIVLLGRHVQLGTLVALKVMRPTLASQSVAVSRFFREAQLASQIRHTNIVTIVDIDTQDEIPFIVMEYVDGETLTALLAKRKVFPLPEIVDLFLPVLSAVGTAHGLGIIHRDLKPANLIYQRSVSRRPIAKVLDFGISKLATSDAHGDLTASETLLGTVQYMAPELTRGAQFASTMSDQYALAVMLYECATGRRPFREGSPYEVMHAIVTTTIIPGSSINPAIPKEFDALIERAMQKDPAKRFPSVEALGSALLSFAEKTTWALWEDEFIFGSSAEGDLATSHRHADDRRIPQRVAGQTLEESISPRSWHQEHPLTSVGFCLGVVVMVAIGYFHLRPKELAGASSAPALDAVDASSPPSTLQLAPVPARTAFDNGSPRDPPEMIDKEDAGAPAARVVRHAAIRGTTPVRKPTASLARQPVSASIGEQDSNDDVAPLPSSSSRPPASTFGTNGSPIFD